MSFADGSNRTDWIQRALIFSLLFNLIYGAWLLFNAHSPWLSRGDELFGTAGGALATLFCFLGWRPRARQADSTDGLRFLIGSSLLCYTVAQVVLAYPDFVAHPIPLPRFLIYSIFIASYPPLLIGILRLPAQPVPLASRTRMLLDSLMIMTALVTFSWYFLLGPALLTAGLPLAKQISAVSYAIADMVQIFCLLQLGARTAGTVMRPIVRLFSLGLLTVVSTDLLWGYCSLHHSLRAGSVLDIGWSLGYMPVGVATAAACLIPRPRADVPQALVSTRPLWQMFLPYALLPAVALLLIFTHARAGNSPITQGVDVGGTILIGLVLLRQVLALLENQALTRRLEGLATTDPLTGLVNHRVFHMRLDAEADRALRDGRPVAIAVLDLDNFKFFNDAYGHAVGDEVLREVASALSGCGRSYDTVARFGGDEFALLLPGQTAISASELEQQIKRRLEGVSYRPPGYDTLIPLTLSVGVALFPDDAATRLEALEIADARLRRSKSGADGERTAERLCQQLSHSLAGFGMLNALVTAVDNKDRYTRRHSEDVLTYSLEIAVEMALSEADRHHVQVAALLHDVGKIGVPDAVLRKPGKLTEDEFEAVKQHPMMGASIVGAVPGFEEALGAIQHHHERWDGGGYPFGLHGADIPIHARIMAVADAFSAMTTDRPYRKGMDTDNALAILRQGAGTQWDPACVAAFERARSQVGGARQMVSAA